MLLMKDILDEKDKRLREISNEVEFPLSKEDKKNCVNDFMLIKKKIKCAGGYGDTGVYKDYGLNYESHSSVYSHDRSHKGKQTGKNKIVFND